MNPHPVSKSRPLSPFRGASRQRGVGLIEVLVAVLVMAIGLLGIALMQTRALSGNNSSMSRSTAVIATYSILEAARADRTNVLAGSYTNKSVSGNSCTAATSSYADTQLKNWCTNLANAFGAAASTTGAISCDTNAVCTVTISYDDSRVGKGGYTTLGITSVTTKVAL